MSPETRARARARERGVLPYNNTIDTFLAALGLRGRAPESRLAIKYESMASDFERQVCEIYQFFSHPSRPMVNSVLSIMLEYLQAEWLLNANMEAEIRLASRTVRRQEKLAIKAPVPVTFRHSAAAKEPKEERLSTKKHKLFFLT